jgi:serine/threonine-protein kinase
MLTAAQRVDKTCDRFERAWIANDRPSIEEFLGDVPGPERSALFGELLKLDLDYRRRSGESPTSKDYQLRFAEHHELIGMVFTSAGPPQSTSIKADHNLLFGILALQMDFISRDVLIEAMNSWVIDKTRSLGQILHDQGHLNRERWQLLEGLLQEHLKAHHQDPQQSLAALSTFSLVHQDLLNWSGDDLKGMVSLVRTAEAAELECTRDETKPAASRFRIVRPHAKGGLGEVFLAEDLELHREVALKEIRARYANDPLSRERFVLEAKITGGLEHPGIVPVYGMGQYEDGRPFYAMRLIKGDNLKEAIGRFHEAEKPNRDPGERSLSFRQLLGRFIAVCNAVAYAHSRGVIHRDLKPANILLGKYGETLVVDWGLAKLVGRPEYGRTTDELTLHPDAGDNVATQFGATIGTPAFMSPEQAAGHLGQLGPASDIYGLGATLYVLLTGQLPFLGSDNLAILEKVQRGDWVPPRQLKKEIPAALDAICRKAMALKPGDRYATALDLAADVEQWLADEPVRAHRESFADQAGRWMRRHRTGVTAAVGNVLLMAAYKEGERHRPQVETRREQGPGSFPMACDPVSRYYTNVSESKELKAHVLEPVRRKLLGMALGFYQQFMQEESDNLDVKTESDRASGLLANLYQAERGRAFARLADLYSAMGRYDQAEEAYQHAQTIFRHLAHTRPHVPEYQKDLAGNYNNLGALYSETGRNQQADTAFQEAVAIQQKLVEAFPQVPEYQRDLAGSYNNLGALYLDAEECQQVETAFRKALAIRKKLAITHPHQGEYQRDLTRTYNNLGALAGNRGRFEQAEAAYRKALAVQKKLADAQPEVVEYLIDLAGNYCNLGYAMAALGKIRAGIKCLAKAIGSIQGVLQQHPRQPMARPFLRNAHWGRAKVLTDLNRHTEAIHDWHRAIELDDGQYERLLRLGLTKTMASAGDYVRAAAAAFELAKGHSLAECHLFHLALVFSLASSAARQDGRLSPVKKDKLAEQYTAQAVELLQKALDAGFSQDSRHLKELSEKDLVHLRSCAAFTELVPGLRKRSKLVSGRQSSLRGP